MSSINQVQTKYLSEELEKREGVSKIIVGPDDEIMITAGGNQQKVEGPAVILINQD